MPERDQTLKKGWKIVANPMKWKCKARKIAHQTRKSYISRRGGNEPEKRVKSEKNEITELITWSDSCVPQNRNPIIAISVLYFLKDNTQVKSVTMKYSLPGHSCVQEVDSIHNNIEKVTNKTDFYPPIGLIIILKHVNPRRPYRSFKRGLMTLMIFKEHQSS
ncbi:hypothetical protein AVEN_126389-1 [Araneus ventricosus]|uniref:Uncharacterized protein n=1 Tax=Araneus ventricosus TaxID=182803 RepID=A0A4Y2GID8_ARAVE|nr:hypothetical protein AVEN_126389-1 [Araneus ventricosus]